MKIEKITFSKRLIVIIMVYHIGFKKKNVIFDFEGFFVGGFSTLKIFNPLYSSKKNCFVYRAHGTQIDRLELTVSMKKSVLKNTYQVPRYWPNCLKI